MNVSFDWYNVFYYVCEFKNVTKAANFLCVSQPAITKHIRDLEKALGKKLVNKTSKGIELTTDGKILYNEIKESIEKLNSTSTNFKNKSGEYDQLININAGFTTIKKFLLPILAGFNKKYPKVKFDISSYDYDVSMQQLREGKSDLIFFALQNVNVKDLSDNIVVEEWVNCKDIFVVKKDVRDKYPDFIKLKDLNNYPIICKLDGGTGRRNLEAEFKKKGLKFLPTYQVAHNWLVEEYVKMGIGIGLVIQNLVEEELKSGEFVQIETDVELPERIYAFAYRKDSSNYHVIKEFTEKLHNM